MDERGQAERVSCPGAQPEPCADPERGSGEHRSVAQRHFQLGRTAWPQLSLEIDLFERHFARHAEFETPKGEIHAADMYLACACAHGVAGALSAFETTFLGCLAHAVASVDASDAFVEEVLQELRVRLFVGDIGGAGKISTYGGRASLRSWLCAVAVRLAISRRRRRGDQRHERFSSNHDPRLAPGGPEFDYLRRRYKDVFEEAVRDAIERLPAKDRMLLRLNLIEGMSIDQLGAMYSVTRSTAARWLIAARRSLFEQARHEVHAKLPLTSTELDSLAAALQSGIEVSVLRLLGQTRVS